MKQMSPSQRIANHVFTDHGNYTQDSEGRNILVSRQTNPGKAGRIIMGLIGIASTILAGGLSFATERANMPNQSFLLGAFAVGSLFQVGLIGYEHLQAANGELPDTVGPQADDRRLLG